MRNSQASVLAPTGCLVGGTLVPTEHGLVRLGSLGDPLGDQWQPLEVDVQTDEGVRRATHFYVNGVEPVVDVTTQRGYRLRGTAKHRIKVVDDAGDWVWRRLADVQTGDLVPLALDQLIGAPQRVALPPLGEGYRWTAEHEMHVPDAMTVELAELVGYFMGDGSLHARGIRLCVSDGDFDVVERLELLGKECFNLAAHVTPQRGYTEVRLRLGPPGAMVASKWVREARTAPRVIAARDGGPTSPRRCCTPTTVRCTAPFCVGCTKPTAP